MTAIDGFDHPLSGRYASPEMLRLYSPGHRYSTWRRLWLVLAEAEQASGAVAESRLPMPVVLPEAALLPLLKALDEAIAHLGGRGTLHPLPEDELQAVLGALGGPFHPVQGVARHRLLGGGGHAGDGDRPEQIGRASCRERV